MVLIPIYFLKEIILMFIDFLFAKDRLENISDMIDCHCHLAETIFDVDRDVVIERAQMVIVLSKIVHTVKTG
jgi:hypothetical protein